MGSERPEKEPVALSQWRTGGSPCKAGAPTEIAETTRDIYGKAGSVIMHEDELLFVEQSEMKKPALSSQLRSVIIS